MENECRIKDGWMREKLASVCLRGLNPCTLGSRDKFNDPLKIPLGKKQMCCIVVILFSNDWGDLPHEPDLINTNNFDQHDFRWTKIYGEKCVNFDNTK